MKKYMICLIAVLLCLMSGCKKQEKQAEKAAEPSVRIEYAAYQYDREYQLSEGWRYDMTISSAVQMREAERLLDGVSLEMQDRMFENGRGYRLIFRDAQGAVTRELLVLENGTVSMDGMMYEAENVGALMEWLHALRIDEQEVE